MHVLYVYVSVCAYVGSTLGVLFHYPQPYSLKTESLTELGATLVAKQFPESLLSVFHNSGVTGPEASDHIWILSFFLFLR